VRVVIGLSALALVGCSSSTAARLTTTPAGPSTASGSQVSAAGCADPAVLSTAIGLGLAAPAAALDGAATTCSYQAPGGSILHIAYAPVPGASVATFQREQRAAATAKATTATAVFGIGEAAFAFTGDDRVTVLAVQLGPQELVLSGPFPITRLETAARDIISR
jgi:hypothetical protein